MKATISYPRGASRLKAILLLGAVFAFTGAGTFGGRRALGHGADIQPSQAELQQARKEAEAAIPRLPADTEEKLSAALYPQLSPIASFSDPLQDRAGLASNASSGTSVARLRPASMTSASPVPSAPAVPDRMARLTQWQQSVRAANASGLIPPPITNAYLISEVAPIGRLNMKGSQGAWFYLESEKRTLSANIGAKFYDGVLVSIGADGIVFRGASGMTRIVQWDRRDEFTTTPSQPTANANKEPPAQRQQLSTFDGGTSRADFLQKRRSTAPVDVSTQDYSDLQTAVSDRYRTTPAATSVMNSEQPSQPDTKSPSPAADSVTVTPTIRPAAKNAPKPQPVQVQGISFKQTPALARQASFAHAQLFPSGLHDGSVRIAPVVYSPTVDSGMDLQTSERLQTAQAQPPAVAKSDKSDSTPAPSATPTPSPAVQEPASTAHVGQISGRLEVGAPTKSIVADQPKAAPVIDTVTADAPSAATPPRSPLCNSVYRGENITITNESNRPLSLLSFINRLNEAYNANIVLDYDVQEIPVRLTINQAPWTSVLRTLLDLNDLDMVCLDGGLVQIAKRSKIAQMGDLRRKAAPIIREVFKLRYLQPTAGGRANLAGQTQPTNGATIQSLEDAIRDILKAGGDTRGEARRVPGRNELLVAATRDQMEEIRDLISRVDRPGYQVKISALVYTANENQLRDLGSQLSIVVGNANNTNLGGFSSLPNIQNNGGSSGSNGGNSGNNSGNNSGSNNGQGVAGRNPGGIPGLAAGMHQPTNGLGAGSPLATFGVTSVFGTAQFAYQLTLAQQRGVVNIQSRPFGIVSDGDTFDLVAGTQIPVVTTTIAGGTPFQSGQVQFIEASRIARITPQVAEDETGRPNFVTLNVQLENNSVDTSLGTFNGVPGVNRQSLQTVLRLHNGETVVIGGLAADQVANSMSKVPGLADIPGFGNLFKKKTKQENRDRLYFAITVEVIPQDATLPNFQAPADAMTTPPPPPSAQRPTPYRKSVH